MSNRKEPSYVYYVKHRNIYYAKIAYNKITYRRSYRKTREEALRDVNDIKREIEEVKANERPKFAENFKPYKNPCHSWLININNINGEVVTQSAVSEEDYESVKAYKWHLMAGKYANGWVNGAKISMHHFILGKPSNGYVVDHIDSIPLNNTRSNLRFATKSQNNQNASKKKSNNYIGVRSAGKKYHAKCLGIHLGSFDTEEEAGRVHDIYIFQKEGRHSLTNCLISYEEALVVKLILPSENKKVRNLPLYISRLDDKFHCRISKNGTKYHSPIVATLDEAIEELAKLHILIQEEENASRIEKKPITRNSCGQAVIHTSKGIEILVDEDMWHELAQYKWHISDGYASGRVNGDGSKIRMHRYIMILKTGEEIPKDLVVDHINNEKLDNRTENLRVASLSLNSHNKRKKITAKTTSKYLGVNVVKNRYLAYITDKRKVVLLGSFLTEIEAAIAYNNKATEIYGKNANLNIIECTEICA